MKEMQRRSGSIVHLNTSDKACLRFGFKSGTRVKDPDKNKATMIGVGKGTGCDSDEDVMYYQIDGKDYDEYYSSTEDLKGAGFKEIK